MKVICIDNKRRKTTVPDEPTLIEGEVYTVVKILDGTTDMLFGSDTIPNCYWLKEIGEWFVFESDRFIPLSEIDETKTILHYEQSK